MVNSRSECVDYAMGCATSKVGKLILYFSSNLTDNIGDIAVRHRRPLKCLSQTNNILRLMSRSTISSRLVKKLTKRYFMIWARPKGLEP